MCAGCTKAAMERAEKMKAENESKVEGPLAHWPPPRLAINCYCGLKRLLPTGLKEQDIFELVSCPKCGSAFRGKYLGESVEQVDE